jgi:hypothetical protein
MGEAPLLKLVFCLRRLPSLTLAELQDYRANRHGPPVRRLQPARGMVRYVQAHRLDTDLADGMRKERSARRRENAEMSRDGQKLMKARPRIGGPRQASSTGQRLWQRL